MFGCQGGNIFKVMVTNGGADPDINACADKLGHTSSGPTYQIKPMHKIEPIYQSRLKCKMVTMYQIGPYIKLGHASVRPHASKRLTH